MYTGSGPSLPADLNMKVRTYNVSCTCSGPSLPADVNMKVQTYRTYAVGIHCKLMLIWKYKHIAHKLWAFSACCCNMKVQTYCTYAVGIHCKLMWIWKYKNIASGFGPSVPAVVIWKYRHIEHWLWAWTACWREYESKYILYTGSRPSLPADINIKVQKYFKLELGLHCLLMLIWKVRHVVHWL